MKFQLNHNKIYKIKQIYSKLTYLRKNNPKEIYKTNLKLIKHNKKFLLNYKIRLNWK